MKVNLSKLIGGFVLSEPILYQLFQAAHQRFKSSISSVTTGSSDPLYLPILSPMESVLMNDLPRLVAVVVPTTTGTETLIAGGVSGFSESRTGETICKISWKLFRAAKETSLFLLSAADWMWSRRTSQACEKSPIKNRKIKKKINLVLACYFTHHPIPFLKGCSCTCSSNTEKFHEVTGQFQCLSKHINLVVTKENEFNRQIHKYEDCNNKSVYAKIIQYIISQTGKKRKFSLFRIVKKDVLMHSRCLLISKSVQHSLGIKGQIYGHVMHFIRNFKILWPLSCRGRFHFCSSRFLLTFH